MQHNNNCFQIQHSFVKHVDNSTIAVLKNMLLDSILQALLLITMAECLKASG